MIRGIVLAMAVTVAAGASGRPAAANTADTGAAVPSPIAAIRDPFWPIGWVPPDFGIGPDGRAGKASAAKWAEARNAIVVTGISRKPGGGRLAVIKNIGIVERGDTIKISRDGETFRWRVADIGENDIVTEPLDRAADEREEQTRP